MLVLSRKSNERIVIDGHIRITVVGIRGNQVRLGIEAPDGVKVYREELLMTSSVDDSPCPLAPAGAGAELAASR